MHIGIDMRLMYHQPAGISRYTKHLVQALSALDQTNQYTLFQHRKQEQKQAQQAQAYGEPFQPFLLTKPNFQRISLLAPVHTRLEQVMLPVELSRYSIDLLHSTDFIPPLYSAIPSVITVHDLAFLHWPHFMTKDSAAYYGQIDRAVRHTQHVIVPSESTKRDLMGQLGVAENKVSVIYEAADELFSPLPVEPTRQEICHQFSLPSRYIFAIGTIEPRKNIDGLLHAFSHLLNKYNLHDTGLVIAGSKGWLYQDVLDTAEGLQIQDNLFFTGRVSDADLQKLYVGARCHVHPAHYEGFGLPPLEAMACGTPTIVSNVSSLPEVVGDAALLVDPKNWEELAVAMMRLLTDDNLHAELRAKGLKRAACFSWTRAAEKTLEIYHKVIHNRLNKSKRAKRQTKRPEARTVVPASTDDTIVSEQLTPKQSVPDQPLPDQPLPDQPTPDQPTPDQPTPDQPAQNQHTSK